MTKIHDRKQTKRRYLQTSCDLNKVERKRVPWQTKLNETEMMLLRTLKRNESNINDETYKNDLKTKEIMPRNLTEYELRQLKRM